jgi:hypothetical protein
MMKLFSTLALLALAGCQEKSASPEHAASYQREPYDAAIPRDPGFSIQSPEMRVHVAAYRAKRACNECICVGIDQTSTHNGGESPSCSCERNLCGAGDADAAIVPVDGGKVELFGPR